MVLSSSNLSNSNHNSSPHFVKKCLIILTFRIIYPALPHSENILLTEVHSPSPLEKDGGPEQAGLHRQSQAFGEQPMTLPPISIATEANCKILIPTIRENAVRLLLPVHPRKDKALSLLMWLSSFPVMLFSCREQNARGNIQF